MEEMMELPSRTELVEETILYGAEIARRFRTPLSAIIKSDGTEATEVDTHVNKCYERYAKMCELGFIGEEGCSLKPNTKHILVVDPLDGSRAFMRGSAGATIIASIVSRTDRKTYVPRVAVIHDPLCGFTWSAERGAGTHFRKGKQREQEIMLLDTDDIQKPYLVDISTWPNAPFAFEKVETEIKKKPEVWEQIQYGGIGIACGLIVSGVLSALAFPSKSAIETVAMQLIAQEAGAFVCDLSGKQIDDFSITATSETMHDVQLSNGVIIAANDQIAKLLVTEIRACQS